MHRSRGDAGQALLRLSESFKRHWCELCMCFCLGVCAFEGLTAIPFSCNYLCNGITANPSRPSYSNRFLPPALSPYANYVQLVLTVGVCLYSCVCVYLFLYIYIISICVQKPLIVARVGHNSLIRLKIISSCNQLRLHLKSGCHQILLYMVKGSFIAF